QEGSGDITLVFTKVPDLVRVSDSSGNIRLVLPPGPATYRVSASTSSGSTSLNVPQSLTSPHVIAVTNQSGDITITRSATGAAWRPAGSHAGERVLQDRQALVQQVLADHERRQEPQDVAEGPAGEGHQAGGVAGLEDLAGGGRVRLQAARLGELDREHRA